MRVPAPTAITRARVDGRAASRPGTNPTSTTATREGEGAIAEGREALTAQHPGSEGHQSRDEGGEGGEDAHRPEREASGEQHDGEGSGDSGHRAQDHRRPRPGSADEWEQQDQHPDRARGPERGHPHGADPTACQPAEEVGRPEYERAREAEEDGEHGKTVGG